MVWLLNSQGMKNCKSTESFCRSILAIYTNDWSTFWLVYCSYIYFFSGKFLKVRRPRTTTYPLRQPGPAGLTFYGSELACLPSCLGMVYAGWLYSMRSEIFLQMKLIIFQGCPTKLLFYLGSLLHIISSLFSYFRSWDYPERFGIYSQLDRKSKTWFFIFLNVYVSWIEQDKILIWQLSPPKFRYFADQTGLKEDPMKMNFDNFQMQKLRFLNN